MNSTRSLLAGQMWHAAAGAPEASILALQDRAPVALPTGYLDLLRFSNGGEGPLKVQPLWFVLDPAEDALEIAASGTFEADFPGLFVIGGNGAGEAIALDIRSGEPWPVVSFDMTNIDMETSVRPIAPDFDVFVTLIGLGDGDADGTDASVAR